MDSQESVPGSYFFNKAAITILVGNHLKHVTQHYLSQNHILQPSEEQNIVGRTQWRGSHSQT
jgi:hypothetical protein